MNWSLIDFLSHSPVWFIAMWIALAILSCVLIWQGTKGDAQ